MARMIGTAQWHQQCSYGCCRGMVHRSTAKAREKRDMAKEVEQELYDERDERHARGICFDPVTKMYGCESCYDDTDYYPPEELDGVPNVLYNGKEPPKDDFSTL